MKRRPLVTWFPFRFALLIAPLMAAWPPRAAMAQLYWDSNGTGAGAGATPTGTWGTNNFWNTTATGLTTTPGAWVAGSTAVFSAGTDAINPFVVTLSGTQTIGGLTVEEGNVTISGGTALAINNAATPLNIIGNANISSVISGTGFGIVKTGAGILTLSGANIYTGATAVNTGILRATSVAGALGAGALSLGGGTLQLANAGNLAFNRNTTVTATSTITADRLAAAATTTTHTLGTLSIGAQTLNITRGANITGTGVGGITFGATNLTDSSNNFAPAANTLLTLASVTGAFNLNKSGAGSMTITGVLGIGAGTLNVTDGLLTLSSNANTFTGVVNVSGTGVIAVPGGGTGDPGALGTGAKVVNLTNGGTIRITSGSNPTSTNQKMFTFGTGGGKLDVNSGVTLTLDDNTGATAQLQGTGDLTKIGAGTLALGYSGQAAGGFSAFGGNIFVNAGTLQAGNANALGNLGGTTTVASGAALAVAAGSTNPLFLAENLTLSGTGITSTGALLNAQAFAATFTGSVTLAANTSIGSSGAGMLTVNGGIGGGAFDLTKVGTGPMTLGGANTYTGITNVSAGGLNLTGSLAANTGLTVAAGAAFSMGSGTANPLTTVSALNLGAGTGTANLGFDLGADTASSDRLVTSAPATTANTIGLNLIPITAIGGATTYDLISAPSGLLGAAYVLNSGGGGYTYTLNTPTDSLVQVNVTPAAGTGSLYWRGVLNNSWSALSATGANTNWTTDAVGTLNAGYSPTTGNTVIFSALSAAGPAVTTTLDTNYSVNDVQFTASPTGVTSVTIGAGAFPGNLTLSPTSSSTGLSVAANAGAVTISAPVVLGAPQTWSADGTGANGSSLTVSGAVSGSGANSLTINNLVTLSAAAGTSTYSGATNVPNGAILQGGATNSFSANSPVTVSGTGILRLNSFSNTILSLTGDGIVQNNTSGAPALTVGDATDMTFSGTLQNGAGGTLGLTKAGAGSLTLSGANTHTGTTTVNAGTLKMGSATALNSGTSLTLNNAGTFDLNGFSASTGGHSSAATSFITNSSTGLHASTATSLNTPAGLVDALNTAATGAVGALITDGGTRQTQITIANNLGNVSFANGANSFSGGLVLLNNAGGSRLSPGTIAAGTPYGTGPIIIGQAATDLAGIYFNTASQTLTNPIIFNTALGNDRVGIRSDVAGITLSGKITANLAPATFTANTVTVGSFFLTGQVTGASGLVLDITSKSASATAFNVTLNNVGTPNDYAGDTVVNFGALNGKSATLNLGAADQIPNGTGTGTVILNTTGTGVGTLNLAGFNETINGLSGSGTVTTGGGTLTLGDNNATASFSGVITGGTLNKMGSGTQTLSGANTYTATNVTGGLIAFATAPATVGPLGNSTIVNLNGGGLSYTGAGTNGLNRSVAIGAGGGTFNVVSATGILTAAGTNVTSTGGNLVKTGAGTLSLSGTTTLNVASAVTVSGGTLQAGFGAAGIGALTVGATGNMNFTNSAIETLTLGSVGTVLTLGNGARLGFELDGATNDGLIVPAGGVVSLTGGINLDFFNLNAGVGANTYSLITAPAGSALNAFTYGVVNAPGGFNYTINKTDTLVSLTTSLLSNRYWTDSQTTGSWSTLNAGPLSNFSTDLAGTLNSTALPGAADTVIFSGSTVAAPNIATTLDAAFAIDSLQFNNQPASVATVSIASGLGGVASPLTLAPVTATNGIRVASAGGDVTISAPVIAGSAQAWTVDNTGLPSSLTLSGNVTFTGAVTKSGAGVLTLSGATNTGGGGFNLSAGTLRLDSNNALGTGLFTVNTDTTIDALTSGRTLNNGAYTANGNFTFTGTDSLDLGASALTLGGDVILTASGSTLTVGGGIGETGGIRSLTKSGAGTLVVNGGTSYNGTTTVTAGTLTLAGTRSGTGSTVLTAGTLNLNGANTGGGGTTLSAGNLNLGHLGALGTGAFTITGGTLNNTAGSGLTLSGNQSTAINGSFTFTGTNSLNLGTGAVTLGTTPAITTAGASTSLILGGNIAATLFGITKEGPGSLTLSGTNTYGGLTNVNAGTLNLSGSLTNAALGNINVIGGSTLNVTGTVTGGPATTLNYGGSATTTVVNVSNNMNLFRTAGANIANSVAVYNQTAGTVNVAGLANNDLNNVANIGYGYFNLTGGTYKIPTRFNVASNNAAAVGVAYVGGTGTLDLSGGEWTIIGYGGSGALTAGPGGTINRTGSTNLFGIMLNTTGAYGVLNVAGGDVINPAVAGALRFGNGNISTTTGFVNLSGGTLTVGANTSLSIGTGSGNFGYFNFGGGTLKAAGTITQFVPASTGTTTFTSTVFGAVTNNNNANAAFNSQIGTTSNFTGGLVVDTNNFPVTFTTPLVAATGVAVTQADIGDMSLLAGNSGYVGAPAVRFSAPAAAGAVPATGYAVTSGGVVTGIVITNPGVYASSETPTITLIGGGGSIAPFSTAALATNNGSGGLIKNGLGTLTLSGANTFTGATSVSNGRLQLNGAAAGVVSTSGISVGALGTLGFTAAAASTLDLTGKPMTLNGGTLNFDIGAPGTNDSISVQDFTLGANSAFTFNSIGAIDGNYTLVNSANAISNSGPFTITGQTIGRVTLTPTVNPNTITVASSIYEGVWNQVGSGNWSAGNIDGPSAPNWDNYKPTITGDAALFGSAITAPSTVAVDTSHAVGYIRFDNANAYTIGANGSSNLNLNNGASNAVVTVTSGSHTIAENVALSSNLLVQPAATTTLTMSGVVSGARNVTVNGPGTAELSGINTYTGTTTVSAGTLRLTGARTVASGVITVGDTAGQNATLDITNGTYTIGGAGSRFQVANHATTAGTGTVNQSGGAIVFTTGGDQLLVGQNTVGNTGIYNLSGGSLTTFTAATRGVMLGVNNNPTPGATSGGGTFNLSGTGALNMTAASGGSGNAILMIGRSDAVGNNTTNVFNQTGGTADVGILAMGGAASGSSGVSSTLNLTGGTFSANSFTLLAGGATNTAVINIVGTAAVTLPAFPTNVKGAGSTATITFDSTTGFLSPVAASTTYLPAGTFTNAFLTANGAKFNVPTGRDITIGQVLGDATTPAAAGTLTKDGVGLLALSGANTYTGTTTISSGTLQLGAAGTTGALSPSSSIVNNGIFATNRTNAVVQGTDFSTAAITGTGGFTKLGTGATTLNAANEFTGPTTITAGILSVPTIADIGTASPLGAGDGATALTNTASLVFNGGSLEYTGADATTNRGFTLTGAGTILLPTAGTDLTIGGNVTGSGALTLGVNTSLISSTSSLRLTGDNSAFTGNVNVRNGNLILTNSSSLGSGTKTVTVQVNTTGFANLSLDGSSGDITLPASISFVTSLANTSSILNVAGNNTINGNFSLTSGNGGTRFESNGGSLTLAGNIAAITGGRVAFLEGTAAGTVSGIISDGTYTSPTAMGVTKSGTGTWTLTGPNTYSGATRITAGILSINTIGAVGAVSSALGAPTTVANGLITMGGAATTGTLIYTGDVQSTDRTIQIGSNSTTPANTDTGGATIQADGAGNAALVFTAANFNTPTNAAAGTGGNRTLTLQGASTGANTISGIIQDNLVSSPATGTATVALAKAGAGTWVLGGANSFSGSTMVTSGTLTLSNSLALQNSPLDTLNSAAGGPANGLQATVTTLTMGGLTGNKDLASVFTSTAGGYSAVTGLTLNPGTGATPAYSAGIADGAAGMTLTKTGAGTQTLSGTSSYTGTTVVTGGVLNVNGSIASSSSLTVGSGASITGSGTLPGNISFGAGAIFAPGNSPGTMTTSGPVSLDAASILNYEFVGNNTTVGGGVNDLLTGVTNLTLGGTLNVTEIGAGSFLLANLGDMWRVMDYSGTLTGSFSAITTPALSDPTWSLAVDTTTANQVNLVVVPETSAVSLLGLATLFTLRRRRTSRAA